MEAHGCSFQVSDGLVLVFWIWVLRIFNESPYRLFSIALSRESLIIKLFKRRVSFRIERGREVGSTRWGGTPVTFGRKIGIIGKEKEGSHQESASTCVHSLLGTIVQFCLW